MREELPLSPQLTENPSVKKSGAGFLRGGAFKPRSSPYSFQGLREDGLELLKIAREKGLVYAIQVAKKMNEPYLLDVLHDTLASEGFYKDFKK